MTPFSLTLPFWKKLSIFAEALDPVVKAAGGLREMSTSPIVQIDANSYRVKLFTENSI